MSTETDFNCFIFKKLCELNNVFSHLTTLCPLNVLNNSTDGVGEKLLTCFELLKQQFTRVSQSHFITDVRV